MPIHPVYGAYENGWKQVPGFENYEVNEHSQVRNKTTLHVLKPASSYGKNRVNLYKDKKLYGRLVHQLCLLAFFPDVPRLESVDHIDEDKTNHFVENLQWLTVSDNTKKSSYLQPRQTGRPKEKRVQQWSLDGKLIAEYPSYMATLRATKFHKRLIYCLLGKVPSYKGFKWTYVCDADLPGEEWKTNEKLKTLLRGKKLKEETIEKIRVSNMGRILTAHGIKNFGSVGKNGYRKFNDVSVHNLIWSVWGDRSPGFTKNGKREFILHNDSAPRDSDGCVSNAIINLRLGDQSENMKEHHAVRKQKRAIENPPDAKRRKLN